MIGVTGYATYVPRYRLDRALIGKAWGKRVGRGSKAVANHDEDALTMAVEVGLDLLGQPTSRSRIDRLYFASTSSPYAEKQVASLVATACDLPRSMGVADFAGSVRAGTSALRSALESIAAGAAREALVAAADTRLGEPESDLEAQLGDAAGGVRVGSQDVIAELVGASSVSEEFTHCWRTNEQRFLRAFEGRFSTRHGYVRDMTEVVRSVLAEAGASPERVRALAISAPDDRSSVEVAKGVGCDRSCVDQRLAEEIGIAGAPDPFLKLARALEGASPGDLVVVGSHGEGADALLFRATEAIRSYRPEDRLDRQIDSKLSLPSYEKYLKYRRVFPGEPIGEAITNVLEAQELRQDVRLYGSRCEACELVQYPMARVCIGCGARERMVEHKLGRRGRVFTFTVDNLSLSIEHPVPMVVVDLEGGGRLYLQATDATEDQVQVGAEVEVCFRRLHEGGGNYNYFWKARPARASS